MPELDYRTAGESHGKACVVIVEGMPAGLDVDLDLIDAELRRRQGGYGRGGRQQIEKDSLDVLSGLRAGRTIGSPIVGLVVNKDHRIDSAPEIHRPRPGHADLAGSVKGLTADCRETLERASARETAARVAAGALAKCLLTEFDIEVVGFVTRIGPVTAQVDDGQTADALRTQRDANEVYCPDTSVTKAMVETIRQAKKDKDTRGGLVEVRAFGLPPGLGSCWRWQDKLDGRIMQAVGSIQAIKGVEIGLGFGCADRYGSEVHDEIDYDPALLATPALGFTRRSNNAGGLEGGMTNGQPLVVRAVMKPISTLLKGLDSVNLLTKKPQRSDYERSDVCAVPAASVVAENVVAFEIARALLEKFSGDTLIELRAAYDFYLNTARRLGQNPSSID
ncbi:MAG: chorismate synthase [Phycisphaerae bacterium]